MLHRFLLIAVVITLLTAQSAIALDDLHQATPSSSFHASAADWPMRGNNTERTATSTSAAPLESVSAVWTQVLNPSTPKEYRGAPIVVHNLVFASTGSELFALHAQTGAIQWRFDGLQRHFLNVRVARTVYAVVYAFPPVYAEGLIFWGGWIEMDEAMVPSPIFAVDAQSGEEVWRTILPRGVQNDPLAANGLVYVSDWDEVIALEAESGQVAWTYKTDDFLLFGHAIALSEGTLFVADRRALHALDARNGSERWNAPINHDGMLVAVADGRVVVASAFRLLSWVSGQIAVFDVDSGDLLWTQDAWDRVIGLSIGDSLVIATVDRRPAEDYDADPLGWIVGFDIATGEKRLDVSVPERLGPPAHAGRILYVPTEKGSLRAIEVSTGQQLWQASIETGRSGGPAIAAGMLFVQIGGIVSAMCSCWVSEPA
jgi:outer membrane protein assembly factor BamB